MGLTGVWLGNHAHESSEKNTWKPTHPEIMSDQAERSAGATAQLGFCFSCPLRAQVNRAKRRSARARHQSAGWSSSLHGGAVSLMRLFPSELTGELS